MQQAPDLKVADPLCCHPLLARGSGCNLISLRRRAFITLLGGSGGSVAAHGAGAAAAS